MKKRVVVIASLWLLAGGLVSPLAAQMARKIEPAASRAELLADVMVLLDLTRPEIAERIASAPSPFFRAAEPEVEVVEETEETEEEAPRIVVKQRLPDDIVLQAFARSFQPKGVLQRGKKFLLSLPDGAMVVEGSGKSLDIRGQTYRVEIATISENKYTLRLGEATLVRAIEEVKGTAARVVRDP